jgi:hypothetical protein
MSALMLIAATANADGGPAANGVTYVVREGDYLTRISQHFGVDEGAVWNHPKNTVLRARRDRNLLRAGDLVFIPADAPKYEPGPAAVTAADGSKVQVTSIELTFSSYPDQPYELTGMGPKLTGRTNAKGTLSFLVPVDVREVEVLFPKSKITYPVLIGNMEPADVPTGAAKRLNHLGYLPFDDLHEDRLHDAVQAFQKASGLEPSGVLDEDTIEALVAAHGS